MLVETSESLQSFGDIDTVSIDRVPSATVDKTTAITDLAKQLAGQEIAAVFYPDGGGGTEKSKFCTVGMHAYFAVPGDSNAESSVTSYVANSGYVPQRPTESYKILSEMDVWGALDGTNNVGELTALTVALDTTLGLIDSGIKFSSVTVLQDSQYVLNSYADWMENWARNGWRKRDGTIVKNDKILKKMMEQKKALRFNSQKVNLKWVKGHGTDVGNNKADELARLGYTLPLGQPGQPEEIFKYKITDRTVPTPTLEEIIEEEIIETSTEVSEKGTEEQAEPATTTAPLSARDIAKLNKERATVNPFMRQTAYYFVTGQVRPDTDEQKYMFSTLFKDSVFGERHPQNGYSLVISKYPSPVLNRIEKLMTEINGAGQICEVALKEAFTAKTYKELVETDAMPFKDKLANNVLSRGLTFKDKPLATIMNPPLRAMLSISYYNSLDQILVQYRNGVLADTADVSITDVTDQFFTVDTSGKTPKTKVVASFTNSEKIHKIKVKPFKSKDKLLDLPLYVGSDMPIRNIIGALSSLNPKVSAITVMEGEDAVRYYMVFEADCGIGIFGSLHSNYVKVLA